MNKGPCMYQWYWVPASRTNGAGYLYHTPMVLGTCITHQWCWVPVLHINGAGYLHHTPHTNGAGYLHHTPMVLGTCITHQWCWVPASHTTYQWCWVLSSHALWLDGTYFNCTDYVIELLAVTSPLINKLIQF